MRKKLLISVITILLFQFTNAQAPTAIWQKCYGGSGDDYIGALSIATSDGGFFIGLQTGSNDGDIAGNHGNLDISLMKLNATGMIQWQKCYGGTGHESITDLFQTSDGGFLIVGTTDLNDGDVSGNHGGNDLWIVKTNSIGTIQWQKCFGGSSDDDIRNIIQTSDGGYIASGYTRSINNGDVLGNTAAGNWVLKISDLGIVQWQKVYAPTVYRILQTPDGGYVFAGVTRDSASLPDFHGTSDIWLAKMNQGGNIQWQKCYGGSSVEEDLGSIIATNDGGYMFSSATYSNDGDVYGNHGDGDYWLVKVDASGTILGQNCYGGSGYEGGAQIQKTLDGGFMLSGSTNSNDGNVSGNHGGYDVWSIKFSSTGAIQWQKCFGGTNDEYGGVGQLVDGTYFAAGNTFSNNGDISENHGVNTADGFLIKLTAANLANDSFAINTTATFPNPIQNILHIDLINELSGKIMDLTGKAIMKVNTKDVDVSSLRAGIYLLDIVSDGKRYIKKIIKQ